MSKIIIIIIVLTLTACGGSAPQPAQMVTKAQYDSVVTDSRLLASELRNAQATASDLQDKVTKLRDENAGLTRRIIEKDHELLLYENSVRDNTTVNSIARWQVFGLPLTALAVVVIAALAALWWRTERALRLAIASTGVSKDAPTDLDFNFDEHDIA